MPVAGEKIMGNTLYVTQADVFDITSSGTYNFYAIAPRIRVVSTDTNTTAQLTVQLSNGSSWSNVDSWDVKDGAQNRVYYQPVGFDPRWRVILSTGTFGGRPTLTLYVYGGYGNPGQKIYYAGFQRFIPIAITNSSYKANAGLSITAARHHLMYH